MRGGKSPRARRRMSSGIPRSSRRTLGWTKHMLLLEGVDAGYDETQVLWGVSLEAKEKSMNVIIGTNGAGKTTILKLVNGRLKPDRATVRINGEAITRSRANARPRLELETVPEARRL